MAVTCQLGSSVDDGVTVCLTDLEGPAAAAPRVNFCFYEVL